MEQYYCDFGNWLRSQFPYKVQKISVNAGFTCPNRDGRIGRGGCIYCNNQTFNPAYCLAIDTSQCYYLFITRRKWFVKKMMGILFNRYV